MNRREFIQITGAVGALAAIPIPMAKAIEALTETEIGFGYFEVKWMQPGADVWIGNTDGTTIWQGTTTGERLKARIPTEINGKEIIITIRKDGCVPLIIRGHKFPADGSLYKIAGWLEPVGPKPHTGEAIGRGEFLAEPVPSRKFK